MKSIKSSMIVIKLTDEEIKAYLRNKDLFSLQMSFSNLNEIQKDRISKIIYSYVFEENEF